MIPREVKEKFHTIGARIKAVHNRVHRFGEPAIAFDISRDRKGELFEFRFDEALPPIKFLDVRPQQRHLLLELDVPSELGGSQRLLCGFDERHWFVANVAKVTTVELAKESLKPVEVVASQKVRRVKTKHRHRRRNAGFVRQGEWFFVPAPDLDPALDLIHRNEPLQRNPRSKPHIIELAYREGGKAVYVCSGHSEALTYREHLEFLQANPDARKWDWQQRVLDPDLYAKGKVRHPDHKTIRLRAWHRVFLNREAKYSTQVIQFID